MKAIKKKRKRERKHALDQESDQEKKKEKYALDQESDQEKKKENTLSTKKAR